MKKNDFKIKVYFLPKNFLYYPLPGIGFIQKYDTEAKRTVEKSLKGQQKGKPCIFTSTPEKHTIEVYSFIRQDKKVCKICT